MTPVRPAREIVDQRALPEMARLSLSETNRKTRLSLRIGEVRPPTV